MIDGYSCIHSFASNNGGAIYIEGNYATIADFDISLTNATNYGGAIYIEGNFVNVYNSNFTRCIADNFDGGALYITGLNATVYNSCFVQNKVNTVSGRGGSIGICGDYTWILNCSYDMCTAFEGGVVYINGSYVLIDDYSCIHSFASNNGGAIYVEGDYVTIADFDISLTNATNYGGAIYVEGDFANIHDSSFVRCIADNFDGGALYIAGLNATVSRSMFMQNKVNTVNGRGGSIGIYGDNAQILNCSYDMCTAFEGGVVYINGSYALIDGYYCIHSFASNNGGAIYVEGDYVTIADFDISLTNATNYGGAIYVEGNHVDIHNSNFTRCIADNFNGGALYIAGLNATVYNSNFVQNKVNLQSGRGGSVEVQGNNAKIINSTFSMCQAYEGAIIYINGSNTYIDTFTSMYSLAAHDGGSIYVAGDNVVFANFNISCSNATVNGGSIYVAGDNAAVFNGDLNACIADHGDGGAIYIGGFNTTVLNCSFDKAKAINGNGGTIFVEGDSASIINSNFVRSFAFDGGIIYIKGHKANISNDDFSYCWCLDAGGALYVEGDDAIIKSNFAYTNASSKDSEIPGLGGAIYVYGSNTVINGSNFVNCYSSDDGGALYIVGDNIKITDSNFTNCHVDSDSGGAIYWIGSAGLVDGCNFTFNFAKMGGAVYLRDNVKTSISNSFFANNSANHGGAIYWNSDASQELINCILIENIANKGSAIYIERNGLEIINSVLLDNRADASQLKLYTSRSDDNKTIEIIAEFKGNDNIINAIWNDGNIVGLTNVTYLGVNGVASTGPTRKVPVKLNDNVKPTDDGQLYQTPYETYQNITFEIYDGQNRLLASHSDVTNISGMAKFTYTNDSNKDKLYEFVFHPQDNYYTEIVNSTSKAIVDVEIPISDIYYLENESFAIKIVPRNESVGTPIGNVNMSLNGELIGNFPVDGAKTLPINLTGLECGTYEVHVRYSGDEKFLPREKTVSFKVMKINSFVIPSIENYTYGESGKLLIQIPKGENNTVNVILDEKVYHVEIDGTGYGQFDVPELKNGKYLLKVEYPETRNYKSSVNSTIFEIYPIINVNIIKSVNLTSDVLVGDLINFTIIISNDGQIPAEDVNVTDKLAEGFQYVSSGSNSTYRAIIFDNEVCWHIGDLDYGTKVLLWVVVKPTTNGTFINSARINTKNCASNKSNEVTVIVTPTVDLSVNKTVNVTSAHVGDEIEYLITVHNNGPNDATNVEALEMLSDNAKITKCTTSCGYYDLNENIWYIGNVSSGTTVTLILTVKVLSEGSVSNSVEVSSKENDSYIINNNCTCENVVVSRYDASIEFDSLSNISYGDDQQIIILMSEDAGGLVNVSVNDISYDNLSIEKGKVILLLSNLSGGDYQINVKYSGDDKYNPASTSARFNVMPVASVINIEAADILEGEIEVLNVTVNAPGTVNITVNGITVEIPLENGVKTLDLLASNAKSYGGRATWILTNLPKGTYDVLAVYSGNENYTGANASGSFTVKGEVDGVNVSVSDIKVGQKEKITVSYPKDATGNVSIVINGNKITKQLKNGTAVFTISNLKSGEYDVEISYSGDDKYLPNNVSDSFKVSKISPKLDVESYGGLIIVNLAKDATGTVMVEINARKYTAFVENGKAEFDIDLKPGDYIAKILYSGDDKYLSGRASEVIEVPKMPIDLDPENVIVDGNRITIYIIEFAKGTMTIEIDGKTYTSQVRHGKAVFMVHELEAGLYKLKVYYSGDDFYDSFTQTVVINITSNDSGQYDNDVRFDGNQVCLAEYPTANPIWILMLVIVGAIFSTRRFKK